MPAIVRLNKKGLADLIENIRNNGNDPPPELDNLMGEVIEDERMRRPVRRERPLRIMVGNGLRQKWESFSQGESSPGRYWLSVLRWTRSIA